MGICAEELRSFVIRPTLEYLGESGQRARAAENLLLGTAAQESGLGFHLRINRARGIGIYQITPQIHVNIWDRYLIDHPDLASDIRGLASQHEFLAHPHAELATNLSYATAIAWMVYRRTKRKLPAADDILGLGNFWFRHFPHRSSETADDFGDTYRRCIDVKASDLAA
ncbi:hypothetical protein ACXYTJ_05085 [Gilvimarinus sp. F26214L]|uniref:hypothetical protein n=1 Tax=Gilvimarinus sp. DZF01 TaxID=3461371 RepID=UPI004045496C